LEISIEIRKLNPELVEDYLHFFDVEDHSDNIAEHKCYCVCWCSDDHSMGIEKMSTAGKRRKLAEKYTYQRIYCSNEQYYSLVTQEIDNYFSL